MMQFRRTTHFVWCLSILLVVKQKLCDAQQQDPLTMNGGSLMAMAGNECVALAVDKRFASGAQMVNIAPRHVWAPHPNLMLAFSGLEGDVQSLSEELKMEVDAKRNRALGFSLTGLKTEIDGSNDETGENRSRISPPALACLTSHVLYDKRGYYVEPLVVGLMEKTRKPFLCAMDMIGAQSFSKSFICSGAASTSLYGTAEALWRPDMKPKELLECCGKAFQSGTSIIDNEFYLCHVSHISRILCQEYGKFSNRFHASSKVSCLFLVNSFL
jgi:20S proteasome subunit beta 3